MRTLVFALLLLLAAPAAASARARDRDRDGMPDRWEKRHNLWVARADAQRDADRDGASNRVEWRAGTNPHRRDSDRDGLRDGYELRTSRTSPRRRDSDRDRVPDGAEDPDRDGLATSREAALFTFPRSPDTDRDRLEDGREVSETRTDPLDPDTDGDGWYDGRELSLGSVPLEPQSKPRKPETKVTSRPGGLTASAQAAFAFESSVPGERFECALDGAAWSACGPALGLAVADGGHVLAVRALNAEGWVDESPASVPWTVDTGPPSVVIGSSPGPWLRSTTASFTFASETGAAHECRVDAGAWHPCSSPASERSLSQGGHTVSVRARDAAGNVSAAVAAPVFTVDTVRPSTALVSWPVLPVPGAAGFEFSSPEAGVGFQCRIESLTSWAACSSPVSFSSIPAGWWRMAVRAVDAAGNVDGSPARVWFESTG